MKGIPAPTRIAFALVLALSALTAPLHARQDQTPVTMTSDEAMSHCMSDLDADSRITLCTQLIDSGKLSDSDLSLALVYRGGAYSDKKDWDQALADFEQSLKAFPANLLTLEARAMLLTDKGEYDQALADLTTPPH
jgi:tetratricopeptide (TPR) repeat protein